MKFKKFCLVGLSSLCVMSSIPSVAFGADKVDKPLKCNVENGAIFNKDVVLSFSDSDGINNAHFLFRPASKDDGSFNSFTESTTNGSGVLTNVEVVSDNIDTGTVLKEEGMYTLKIKHNNGATDKEEESVRTFYIDKTAPTFYWDRELLESGSFLNVHGSLTISISDGNGLGIQSFEITKDGNIVDSGNGDGRGDEYSTPTTRTFSLTGEGTYTISATDNAGNTSSVDIFIDNTEPEISGVVNKEDVELKKGDINQNICDCFNKAVTVKASDNGDLDTVYVNDTLIGSSYTVSAEGFYTVIATDKAGNSKTVNFIVDKTAPSISGFTNGAYYNTPRSVGFADENFSWSINSEEDDLFTPGVRHVYTPFNSETSTVISQLYLTENGKHTLYVTDKAGNTTSRYFYYDNVKPTLKIDNDAETNKDTTKGTWYNKAVVITGKDNSAIKYAKLTTYGMNGKSTVNKVIKLNSDGQYTVKADGKYKVTIYDMAGNATSGTFNIDKSIPKVSGVKSGSVYKKSVTVKFSDKMGATATLNGTNISTGKKISTSGKYTLVVTDKGGNKVTYKFTVDKSKPTVSGVENNKIYNANKTITFSDDYSTVTAKLDGATITSGAICTKEGSHTLVVKDAAKNKTTVKFKVDKTAPSISGVANAKSYNKSARYKVVDKISGFKSVTLDGKTVKTSGRVKTKGSHTLKVTDKAGNTKTITFTVK